MKEKGFNVFDIFQIPEFKQVFAHLKFKYLLLLYYKARNKVFRKTALYRISYDYVMQWMY